MRYEHTAANTNHTALTVSPRMPAMTTQLTPPSSEMPTHRAIFAGVHLVSCDSRAASSSATGGSPGSCWRISELSGDPYGASTLAPIITPGIREINARARVTLPPRRGGVPPSTGTAASQRTGKTMRVCQRLGSGSASGPTRYSSHISCQGVSPCAAIQLVTLAYVAGSESYDPVWTVSTVEPPGRVAITSPGPGVTGCPTGKPAVTSTVVVTGPRYSATGGPAGALPCRPRSAATAPKARPKNSWNAVIGTTSRRPRIVCGFRSARSIVMTHLGPLVRTPGRRPLPQPYPRRGSWRKD